MSIHNDGAANIVITDANEQFTATGDIPGASLSNDNKTLTVPLASIPGTKIIIHGDGGDDALTVDLTDPLGKLLDFHGGDGDDALVLTGGSAHTSTFTYVSASDGSVALDLDGPGPLEPWNVTYTGLAPITSSIASDVVELVYTGGDETITVSDAGGGQTTAVSTLGELTTFTNPTQLLRIVATGGTDTIDVGSLAAGYASLEIAADDTTDVVNFLGAITFAEHHGLTVTDVGTVNLPNPTSQITASGSGAVSMTALRNIALESGSSLVTVDGEIHLSANLQATPTSGTFIGVSLCGASVGATGAGKVHVTGRGGTEGDSFGIRIRNDGQLSSTIGTSGVVLTADSMMLNSTTAVHAGANQVTLRPLTAGTRIDLGGADVLSGSPLTLGLTAAELDRITVGTLTIGEAASGTITVSESITRSTATDLRLVSGDAIVFDPGSIDTGGGILTLAPGSIVSPRTIGVDMTAASVLFAEDSPLAFHIDGTAVDSEYSQLNVHGTVDLTGTQLALDGTYTPALGDVFTVVSATSLTGRFNGLNHGDALIFNDVPLTIHYTDTMVTLRALATTTTVVESTDNPSIYGDTFHFIATVIASQGVPTGAIQFSVNGTDWGDPVTLTNAVAHSPAVLKWNVGIYTITTEYQPAGSSGFTSSSGQLADGQQITQAGLMVTGITAADKDYDGTTDVVLDVSDAALAGVLPNDIVILNTVDATGAFQDPGVGTEKTVTISGLTLEGSDANNYSLLQPTTTASIRAVVVSISPAELPLLEGNDGLTPFVFTVALSAPVASPVTVRVDTVDGTATVGDGDYQPLVDRVLTFLPGEGLEQTVTVYVIGDTRAELDETFFVELSEVLWDGTPDDRVSLGVDRVMATILNDDPWLTHLSASPDPVIYPGLITLTAHPAEGADQLLTKVAFYRGDHYLGSVSGGGDAWSLTAATTDWELGHHTLSASARNLDDTWSEPVSVTASVYAEHRPVLFGTVPLYARKEQMFTVQNSSDETITVLASGWNDPFTIQPADGASGEQAWQVAPGTSREYVIAFAPVEAGEMEVYLTLAGDDSSGSVARISGLGVAGWQNPLNPYDVNGDGHVTPLDALLLINQINLGGDGPLSPRTPDQPGPSLFLDVTGSGTLVANDVLQVINYINRGGEPQPAGDAGEGEPDDQLASLVRYNWLAAVDAGGFFLPETSPGQSAASAPQTDLRVDWLTAAVDDLPLEQETWQRQDAAMRETDDGDLRDWELLLDDPATDLVDLDAYFAALA